MDFNTTSRRRALVVGLGISGTASALRLHRIGWDVVVLEKAAERRRASVKTAWAEHDSGTAARILAQRASGCSSAASRA